MDDALLLALGLAAFLATVLHAWRVLGPTAEELFAARAGHDA